MARVWCDDARLLVRAAGPANARFLAWLLAAVLTAGASGGAYTLTVVRRAMVTPAAPAHAAPPHIMPLGDSITPGPGRIRP